MPRSFPTLSMTAMLVGAALTLAGCRKNDVTTAVAPAPVSSASTEPASSPPLDFWKLVLPEIAASYGGQCINPADKQAVPGAIALRADGKAAGGAISGDLAGSEFFLGRVADGSSAAGYTVSAKGGNLELLVQPVPHQADSLTASLMQGEAAISCSGPAKALPLAGKSLYTVFAHLLDSPARSVQCTGLKGIPATLDYQLAQGVFTLGQHRFELARAQAETAAVVDSSREFGYMAQLAPQQEVHVVLDQHGKLRTVMLRLEKSMLQCDRLNQAAPPG